MTIYSDKLRLTPEHKAFVKDLATVIVSYTPVSGVFDTMKFGHKWFGKRQLGHRIAKQIKKRERKSYIKGKGRKIVRRRRRVSGTAF